MNVSPPEPTKAVVAANFNSITIENAMKWDAIQNPDGSFNFGPADDEVAWANQHHIRVRAHALLFHRTPTIPWARGVIEKSSDPRQTAHDLIGRFVTGVVGHFRGRVASWDVVNEPLGLFSPPTAQDPCPWGSGWDVNDSCVFTQRNFFYTTLGETYIDEAFRLAHDADPGAKLFLNELLWNPKVGDAKADALLALVKRLKDRGVPIDGVGLELHGAWSVTEPMFPGTRSEFLSDAPTMKGLVDYIKRLGNLGVRVEFTEVDVSMAVIKSTVSPSRPASVSDAQALDLQAKLFGRIGRSCAAAPACSGVTVWGLTDPESWLTATAPWQTLRPLLFDDAFAPKAGYSALRDGLLERCPLRGTQPQLCSIPWTSPPAPTVTWTKSGTPKTVTATLVAGANASSYSVVAKSGSNFVNGSCVFAVPPARTVCTVKPGGGRWSISVTPSNNWSDGPSTSRAFTL